MGFVIKDPKADKLARELAAITGESLTEAVTVALEERRARLRSQPADKTLVEDIEKILQQLDALPVLDDRCPEEILGYDQNGLPN